LTQADVIVPRDIHDLPHHPENLFPKFDPDKNECLKGHITRFMMDVRLMNVQHEDAIFFLFPYIF